MELAVVESEVEFTGRVEEHDFVVGIQEEVYVSVGICSPNVPESKRVSDSFSQSKRGSV